MAKPFNFGSKVIVKRPNSSLKRLPRLLNGLELASLPHDGICHYGYTGKAWIMWRDGILLGFGDSNTDVYWIEGMLNAANNEQGVTFVDLLHGAPPPYTRAFARWHEKEEQKQIFEKNMPDEAPKYGIWDTLPDAFSI